MPLKNLSLKINLKEEYLIENKYDQVVQKRPIEDAVAIFDEMEKGTIQGRMVIDMGYHKCSCGCSH